MATRDVDLLAIAVNGQLRLAEPLPDVLLSARVAVARDFAAARWSVTQDPSPGYRSVLVEALRYLGVDDAGLAT